MKINSARIYWPLSQVGGDGEKRSANSSTIKFAVCVNSSNQIHIYILWFLFTVKYKLPSALFSSHVRLNNLWSALEGISGEGLEVPEACGLHPSPEVSKTILSSTFGLSLAPNKVKSLPSQLSNLLHWKRQGIWICTCCYLLLKQVGRCIRKHFTLDRTPITFSKRTSIFPCI